MRRVVYLLALALSWPAWAIDIGPCRYQGICVRSAARSCRAMRLNLPRSQRVIPLALSFCCAAPAAYAGEALEMGDIIWRSWF